MGISFDQEVVELLDNQVTTSLDLSADRSEIVNAMVKFFLNDEEEHANRDTAGRVRELLVRERKSRMTGTAGGSDERMKTND